jgi:hypothetical protein
MAPKRSHSFGGGREAFASRGRRASRGGEGAASRGVDGAVVSRSAQSLQQAASHLAGGKQQRDQVQGARGGAGNGSEDGGSSGSDGGAARRVVDRHRTPEQVCLSLDSVCTGAPGLIAL